MAFYGRGCPIGAFDILMVFPIKLLVLMSAQWRLWAVFRAGYNSACFCNIMLVFGDFFVIIIFFG